MDVPVAVLCDAATDYGGKLNLLGAFDAIMAREFPMVHPSCMLAVRVIFEPYEMGEHRLVVKLTDEDGMEVIDPLEAQAVVKWPPGRPTTFVSRNLIVGMKRLKFARPGRYELKVMIDGHHLATAPLLIMAAPSGGSGGEASAGPGGEGPGEEPGAGPGEGPGGGGV